MDEVPLHAYFLGAHSKWVRLNGDGELVWGPDPELNELGVEQARDVNRAWRAELNYNIPLPEKLYTSPLSRAIKTNQISFENLLSPDLKTTIVEIVREKTGVSTFNRRRKKSEIERDFPDYPFEQGFTEEDECWDPDTRETPEELDARAKKVLDMVFDDDGQFISITTHHGFIEAFLRVCNHRPWKLPTGGVMPIVLKAEQQLQN
ncbi:histidine phosphatase superfamily [Chiua virens]|nr:histidine phosphatase superfamily [Chiua virens]